MYNIGLDVHKKMISYCLKGERPYPRGRQGGATGCELNDWMKTLP